MRKWQAVVFTPRGQVVQYAVSEVGALPILHAAETAETTSTRDNRLHNKDIHHIMWYVDEVLDLFRS